MNNNIKNFREISYLNKYGYSLKSNLIFRSGDLTSATKKDLDYIYSKGVRTIIDLRTIGEAEARNDIYDDRFIYYHLPIYNNKMVGITHEKTALAISLSNIPVLSDLYPKMVLDPSCIKHLSKIFNTIASFREEESAILIHCTAGKDRTGITLLILLYILGIDIKHIVKDYTLTNKGTFIQRGKVIAKATIGNLSKEHKKALKQLIVAKKEYIYAAYDSIVSEYGSMDKYISDALKLSEDTLSQIRHLYINY